MASRDREAAKPAEEEEEEEEKEEEKEEEGEEELGKTDRDPKQYSYGMDLEVSPFPTTKVNKDGI